MFWICSTIGARQHGLDRVYAAGEGRVGKRRKAAALKAIRSGDRDAISALSRPAPLRLNVVGGFYDKVDGASRQDETRKLKPGDPVELRREPDNKFDPSAVAVFSERGIQIGYLGEQRTAWIGSKIDKGLSVRTAVDRLIGCRGDALKPCCEMI